jgi:beta-glucanase (GH16 family)
MIAGLILAAAMAAAPVAPPVAEPDWKLVWSDEFGGSRIDRRKWDFDVDCAGGGNEERQCYTARRSNASVGGGYLSITARRETWYGPAQMHGQPGSTGGAKEATKSFTSARLVTRGKASWRYGRVEVRARLPLGQGSWPAIWMLPEKWRYGSWPRSGEIDIMEAVNLGTPCVKCAGGRENHVLGTIHFGDHPPANKYLSTEVELSGAIDGFHTYRVDWSPERIAWSVDGRPYVERLLGEWSTPTSTDPHAPFDQPFHLILNLAIGGHLPEGRNLGGVSLSGFPRSMQVDWVRVWQRQDELASPDRSKGAEWDGVAKR